MAYVQRGSPAQTVLPLPVPLGRAVKIAVPVLVVAALAFAAGYENGVFGPVLVQSLLLVGVIYAIVTRRVGQLFDIFAPNSAAEAGIFRRQFVVGKTHYTWNWLVNLSITLICWAIVFGVLWLLATDQPTDFLPMRLLVGSAAGRGISGGQFALLTLRIWFVWWLPCGIATLSLWLTERFNPGRPEKVDYHGLALLAVCAILGTLSLSVAEFWLGLNKGVGILWSLFALLPIGLLIVRLFSPWLWTEGGKGVMNEVCATNAASAAPLATMDFLQVPPPVSLSDASRGRPQTGVHRAPNHDGPVVIVCASGGGSRATLFSAGILSRMWWQDIPAGYFTPEEKAALKGAAQAAHGVSTEQTSAEQTSERKTEGQTPDSEQAEALEQTADYPGRLLLQCVDAISSVSGGSLASSYFVESLHRALRDTFPTDNAAWGRWRALNAFFDPKDLACGEARPATAWYAAPQEPQSLQSFFACPDAGMILPKISGSEDRQSRFEANPFINAMSQDNLAACIAGFFAWRADADVRRGDGNGRAQAAAGFRLSPFGRGPNIERFWEQSFSWYRDGKLTGLSKCDPVRLHDLYAGEKSGHLPALVLNGTLAGTGTRLAITNLDNVTFQESRKFGPVVDARDLGEGDMLNAPDADASGQGIGRGRKASSDLPSDPHAAQRQAAHRFDPLPAQINTLNALDDHWEIPLKSATRASANFPVGFPLMRFRRYKVSRNGVAGQPVTKPDGTPDILDICDGGVLDNTGVDTAMALVRANRDAIRERGVLLFLIDSGELPRNPGLSLLDKILYNLSAVRNCLWRTNLNTQAALHSEYLDELKALFESELETKMTGGMGLKALRHVFQTITDETGASEKYTLGFEGDCAAFYVVRAGELNQDHVMTSWHLDVAQRALLHDETLQPQQGEAILRASLWFASRLLDNQRSRDALRAASP